ncbi:MAG: hypothetical protein AAGK01_07295 [Pseudomonadota bacterium]
MSIPYGGTTLTHYMGGPGGSPFPAQPVNSISLSYGDILNHISLNCRNQYGSSSGGSSAGFSVGDDRYIVDIEYSVRTYAGHQIVGGLRFHLSDKTVFPSEGQYGTYPPTNSMRQDLATQYPISDETKLRVLALGGHYGDCVDALSAIVVVGYEELEPVKRNQYAIIEAVVPGQTLTTYTEVYDQMAYGFSQSWTQTNSMSVNESISALFEGFGSIGCNFKNTYSQTQTVGEQFQAVIEEDQRTTDTYTVAQDGALLSILKCMEGDIYDLGGNHAGQYVFIPHANAAPFEVSIKKDNVTRINGYYDLNNYIASLSTAMAEYEDPSKNGGMNVVKVTAP